ncbi:CmcJ/NvfI family oxidoreductase [Amycolatopsis rhabdoformis]|uniref:CmcJ/NvfI family oxidoreductase n=1 Tax=Amycolatopsis rhabdoformis TaxID=1448059 RepID=A0ABZ1IEH8_9PSEU|nr:CmcJ/NvfI family oxidoreductase [Amycolatopsis rhabdoformis]WSE32327.1 CmcJ/NvfI family oxidoreductase [Amycolatopsis rhabdoformis]
MTTQDLASVTVPLQYADPARPSGIFYAGQHAASTASFRSVDTAITNARPISAEFSLDLHGFALVKHRTSVQDFTDAEEVDQVYKAELEDLVKAATGAVKVVVFHTMARFEDGEVRGERPPARAAHADYDGASFEVWIRRTMGAEADEWLAGRWSEINVWRGIRPVERVPLAVADARTTGLDEYLPVPIHERPGQPTPFIGLNLMHHPKQRWYYFADMQPDEALLFRLWDTDPSVPFPVAHSAIDDPTSRPDAAPRASVEARTVAFFGPNP